MLSNKGNLCLKSIIKSLILLHEAIAKNYDPNNRLLNQYFHERLG